ncbi:MAG: TIGR01777 family oxidoreductase [Bacteroidetes bacterium]|nr:TIGR01777 family oxidoreductase [Bacteroidota bacterium]MDA0903130.1 TIGR01777 family oxidoreductase [Bacteroidota bacterium]MDA1242377.1 TIGR01777 family oxidoreductase [Bacteroidota bacterium]
MKSQIKIAITGASGLLGRAMVDHFATRGHQIWTIGRGKTSSPLATGHIPWDPAQGMLESDGLKTMDVVIHLAGANVGQRWTARHRRAILESRVLGTRLLMHALKEQDFRGTLLCASAVGLFGDSDMLHVERDEAGTGFLADVVKAWEQEMTWDDPLDFRVVGLRLGVVLSPDGGSLQRMKPIYRCGLGAPLGTGMQWMSWIHIDDAVGAFDWCLQQTHLRGPVHVVAPQPVQNRNFSKALARVLGSPHVAPRVPSWVLRMMLGDLADVVLHSQRVSPSLLEQSGFIWRHPDLEGALKDCLCP